MAHNAQKSMTTFSAYFLPYPTEIAVSANNSARWPLVCPRISCVHMLVCDFKQGLASFTYHSQERVLISLYKLRGNKNESEN